MPALDCNHSKELISGLEKANDGAVPWTETSENERTFTREQIRHYRNPIRLIGDMWASRGISKNAEAKDKMASAHLRLIIVELALRCYKAEQGRASSSLNELAPNYLRAIPLDPFTNAPLVYRPQGTNWLLYSIGADKLDDKGSPVKSGSLHAKGDLFFDSPW